MTTKRWTLQPTGKAAERLQAAVNTLRAEGIVSSEAAAVTLIIVRGLDVIEAEQTARMRTAP